MRHWEKKRENCYENFSGSLDSHFQQIEKHNVNHERFLHPKNIAITYWYSVWWRDSNKNIHNAKTKHKLCAPNSCLCAVYVDGCQLNCRQHTRKWVSERLRWVQRACCVVCICFAFTLMLTEARWRIRTHSDVYGIDVRTHTKQTECKYYQYTFNHTDCLFVWHKVVCLIFAFTRNISILQEMFENIRFLFLERTEIQNLQIRFRNWKKICVIRNDHKLSVCMNICELKSVTDRTFQNVDISLCFNCTPARGTSGIVNSWQNLRCYSLVSPIDIFEKL